MVIVVALVIDNASGSGSPESRFRVIIYLCLIPYPIHMFRDHGTNLLRGCHPSRARRMPRQPRRRIMNVPFM